MELRQLRYLERIVATGGFRSAARELGITQPTLSAQMKQLEHDLGVELIDRSTRPVRTTPAGEQIIGQVRMLLASLERLESEVAELSQQQTGRLTLGTHQSVTVRLPAVMAGFAVRHPDIDVRLVEAASSDATTMIQRGELDACVIVLRTGVEHLPADLQSIRLFSFEYVFAVPADHRLAGRTLVKLADLANERLILSSGASGAMTRDAFASAGVTAHIAFETNDSDMLTSLVERGLGIGFVPEFKVASSPAHLQFFKASDLSVTNDAVLAWAGRRSTEPMLRAFVSYAMSQHWLPDEPAITV